MARLAALVRHPLSIAGAAIATASGTAFSGCFRCHDGAHADAAGSTVSAECELCHKDTSPALYDAIATAGSVTSPHPR